MTASVVKSALTDRQAVACTIYGEARREQIVGQLAIGWVIRNRLLLPSRFGAGWKGVCHRRSQFSCWFEWGGPSNYAAVMASAEQLVQGRQPKPGTALARALQVADDVMVGLVPDPTRRADHYYAPAAMLPPGRVPDWAIGKTPTVVIDAHRFYRLA